jgi:hypothetical protein
MFIITLLLYGLISLKSTHIAVFNNTDPSFSIQFSNNTYYYRESILPLFVLDFKNNNYDSSTEPIYNTFGSILYGTNALKDILLNNEWSLIDSVTIKRYQDDYVHILSSTRGLDSYAKIHYQLYDNNNIIDTIYDTQYMYFQNIYLPKGLHNISLWGKYTRGSTLCLCPSMKQGFSMGYQIAIWDTEITSEKLISTNSLIGLDTEITSEKLISTNSLIGLDTEITSEKLISTNSLIGLDTEIQYILDNTTHYNSISDNINYFIPAIQHNLLNESKYSITFDNTYMSSILHYNKIAIL